MARSADESAIAETQRKKKKDVEAPSYVFEQIRWDGVSTDHPLFDVIKARVGDSPVSDMIVHDARRRVELTFHDILLDGVSFHAIDATFSPQVRLLDGVEVH